MKVSVASCTIVGVTPLSQSRNTDDDPKGPKEHHDDYDKRIWRKRLNTAAIDGKPTVVIPAHGMHQAIAAAAKYSKTKIPGQRNATWTAKFTAGIAILDEISLGISPEDVDVIAIYANADGVRGSGTRVTRRFPIINPGWRATFDVTVLDQIITEDVFREMLDTAGMFIGVGRFRPEKGGSNGRFNTESLKWIANKEL